MTFDNATWRKSSRSASSGGACVEVAFANVAVGVRDSKSPDAGHHEIPPAQWRSFLADIKNGRFDLR